MLGLGNFQGLIDEVRVWNVARSEAAIQSTMNTPLIGNEPGLVGYWKFNEGSGQTAYDSTLNSNDGQLGSTPGVDPSDPAWFLISPQGDDVLWLTIEPVTGTVPAYSSVPVEVTFDATGMEPGDYTAEIVVLSNDPVTPWVSIPVTMTVVEPVVADFAGDPTTGVAPLEVTFTNQSTGDYVTCDWDFGDDGTSNVCVNPIHTYTVSGVYTVALTVSSPGGTDTLTRPNYVSVYEPHWEVYLPLVLKNSE